MWISNPYRVHQRLCMAFPDAPQVARDDNHSLLFRIESTTPPSVLVQSVEQPEWERAFGNAGFLLVEPPKMKEFNPVYQAGERYRFFLRANPTTKKALPRKDAPVPESCPPHKAFRRFGLKTEEEQVAWFHRKAADAGFEATELRVITARPRVSRKSKMEFKDPQIHRAADYTGVLEVRDPEKLRKAIVCGIGPAKGYGFGLLSLARIST
jgi:CRISPR system Cascade subunit CasE